MSSLSEAGFSEKELHEIAIKIALQYLQTNPELDPKDVGNFTAKVLETEYYVSRALENHALENQA